MMHKLFICIIAVASLGIYSSAATSSKKQPKTIQTQKTIDIFKPFTWEDNLYTIVQKVKTLPGITTASLRCDSNEINILNIDEFNFKQKFEDSILKTIRHANSNQKLEYFTNNGSIQKSHKLYCTIEASPIIINNAEYLLSIGLDTHEGANVIYPDKVLKFSDLIIPMYINELKIQALNMDSKYVLNSDVAMNLYNKYKHLRGTILRSNGVIYSVTIRDSFGHEIEMENSFSREQKYTLSSGLITYKLNEQYLDDKYEELVVDLKKNNHQKIDLSNNF